MTNIMVAGSASGYKAKQAELAQALGLAIAKADCTLVNGACAGLPFAAAEAARSAGGQIIAVSPASCLSEHTDHFGFPSYPANEMRFTGRLRLETWVMYVQPDLFPDKIDEAQELHKQFALKFRNGGFGCYRKRCDRDRRSYRDNQRTDHCFRYGKDNRHSQRRRWYRRTIS